MKKVLILSVLSLFSGMSMQAQSSGSAEKKEITPSKSQTEIKQVTKINRVNVAPVVSLKNARISQQTQPVKKEEEVKSIETNQK
jgi:hypothetical protein